MQPCNLTWGWLTGANVDVETRWGRLRTASSQVRTFVRGLGEFRDGGNCHGPFLLSPLPPNLQLWISSSHESQSIPDDANPAELPWIAPLLAIPRPRICLLIYLHLFASKFAFRPFSTVVLRQCGSNRAVLGETPTAQL